MVDFGSECVKVGIGEIGYELSQDIYQWQVCDGETVGSVALYFLSVKKLLTFEDNVVLLVVQVFSEWKYEKCVPYIAIKENQITHISYIWYLFVCV
jgi:hypothetical protein